ncbi:unnamed protein product, partial [Prorocentrum cordatum]
GPRAHRPAVRLGRGPARDPVGREGHAHPGPVLAEDGHRQVADRSPAPRCGRAPRRRAARALHQRHRAPAEGSHDHRQQREPKAVELPAGSTWSRAIPRHHSHGLPVPGPVRAGAPTERSGPGPLPCRAARRRRQGCGCRVHRQSPVRVDVRIRAGRPCRREREGGHPEPRTPPGVCLLQACGRARCGRCQHERHGRYAGSRPSCRCLGAVGQGSRS